HGQGLLAHCLESIIVRPPAFAVSGRASARPLTHRIAERGANGEHGTAPSTGDHGAREDSLGTSAGAERAESSPRVGRCWLSNAFHNSSAMEAHGLETTGKPSAFRCGAGGPGQYCPSGDWK